MFSTRVPVSDIGIGSVIVTKKAPKTGKVLGTKTLKAEDISICEGQWRSHIHINGGCYDTRLGMIDIAQTPEDAIVAQLFPDLLAEAPF